MSEYSLHYYFISNENYNIKDLNYSTNNVNTVYLSEASIISEELCLEDRVALFSTFAKKNETDIKIVNDNRSHSYHKDFFTNNLNINSNFFKIDEIENLINKYSTDNSHNSNVNNKELFILDSNLQILPNINDNISNSNSKVALIHLSLASLFSFSTSAFLLKHSKINNRYMNKNNDTSKNNNIFFNSDHDLLNIKSVNISINSNINDNSVIGNILKSIFSTHLRNKHLSLSQVIYLNQSNCGFIKQHQDERYSSIANEFNLYEDIFVIIKIKEIEIDVYDKFQKENKTILLKESCFGFNNNNTGMLNIINNNIDKVIKSTINSEFKNEFLESNSIIINCFILHKLSKIKFDVNYKASSYDSIRIINQEYLLISQYNKITSVLQKQLEIRKSNTNLILGNNDISINSLIRINNSILNNLPTQSRLSFINKMIKENLLIKRNPLFICEDTELFTETIGIFKQLSGINLIIKDCSFFKSGNEVLSFFKQINSELFFTDYSILVLTNADNIGEILSTSFQSEQSANFVSATNINEKLRLTLQTNNYISLFQCKKEVSNINKEESQDGNKITSYDFLSSVCLKKYSIEGFSTNEKIIFLLTKIIENKSLIYCSNNQITNKSSENDIKDKIKDINSLLYVKNTPENKLINAKLSELKSALTKNNVTTKMLEYIINRYNVETKGRVNEIDLNKQDYIFDINFPLVMRLFKDSKDLFPEQSMLSVSSIPNVKWEDVGGLEDAKAVIYDTIQLPLKFPNLFNNSLKKRSGLLIFGPPGSGKTLMAKAIATESSMNFISVKGPELLNQYVGESEKNIRDVFMNARNNAPCVLFFDELDSLAPIRSKNSDNNSVMDRIVSQFMAEMDNITSGELDNNEVDDSDDDSNNNDVDDMCDISNNKNKVKINKAKNVIIISSTNRPDLIDTALLRPGRFDKLIYVGIPSNKEEKLKVLMSQTLKVNVKREVLEKVSESIPNIYSGADIAALCSTAYSIALKSIMEKLKIDITKLSSLSDDKDCDKKMEALSNVELEFDHFNQAIMKVPPSLNEAELNKYQKLKEKFQCF